MYNRINTHSRILLVEDEAIIALNEKMLLEKHGHEVVVVYSGEDAVERVGEDPDLTLVLMDIDLGAGIDGTEAATQILQLRALPLLFLTSHTEEEYVQRAKEITHYGYVLKSSGEFVLRQSVEMAYKLFDSHQRLQAHEEQLRLAMDAADHGYWDWNLDTNDAYFSPRYCEMLGYEADELPMTYYTWERLLHPEDRDAAIQYVAERVKRAEPFDLEFRLQTKCGQWKWIRGKGKSYHTDREGFPHRVVGTQEDVSDRKRLEGELRESEAHHRFVAENIRDIVVSLDIESESPTYITPSVEKVLGYSVDEALSLTVRDIYTEETYAQYKQVLRDAIEKGETQLRTGEYEAIHRTGKSVPLEIRSSLVWDRTVEPATPKTIVSVVRDISKRKKVEQELQATCSRLQRIVDNAPFLINEIDAGGHYMLANEATCKYLGLTKETLIGSHFRHVLPEETAKTFQHRVSQVVSTGEALTVDDHLAVDGKDRVFRTVLSPTFDQEARVHSVVGIGYDVTENVREFEYKDFLLRELNHRIKNNLSFVSSLIHLKDSEFDESVDLSDLTYQVQAIEKVHAALQTSDEVTHIRVQPYIEDILSTIFRAFNGGRVRLRVTTPDITIRTNTAVSIGLIINETATNAVKHGFGAEEQPRFTVTLEEDVEGTHYILSIANSGTRFPDGLDVENSEGLGMKLITALVSQLEGQLEVQRTPETTFKVRFPKPETHSKTVQP